MTSPWFDLHTALQEKTVITVDLEGQEISAEEFSVVFSYENTDKDTYRASQRWAIVVNSQKQQEAALQGLPCPKRLLKLTYRANNVAVRLAKVPFCSDMDNGISWSGPIPLLF
jgi:hypothetical protein